MSRHVSQQIDGNELINRTAIVSGGCGVLGRAICAGLGAAGANVVVNDINADAVHQFVSELSSKGYTAFGVPLSATNGSEILHQTIEKFGSVQIVINAVSGRAPHKPFESTTDDDFRSLFEVNVLGSLSLSRAAWPYFKEQSFGRIINFTSDSMLGLPHGSAYTMTKGALLGLNKTLALEGASHNINVNCVSPIAFSPQMEPVIAHLPERVRGAFRALYTPEGCVLPILALVSDNCRVSGEVIQVAGCAVSRNVFGTFGGVGGLQSIQHCLNMIDSLCKNGSMEIFEPTSATDFLNYQIKYVLDT